MPTSVVLPLALFLTAPDWSPRTEFSDKTKVALVKVIAQRAEDWRNTKKLHGEWRNERVTVEDSRLWIWRFNHNTDRTYTTESYRNLSIVSKGSGWYQFEGGKFVIYPWNKRTVADISSAHVYEVKRFTDDELVVERLGVTLVFKRFKP